MKNINNKIRHQVESQVRRQVESQAWDQVRIQIREGFINDEEPK